MRKDWMKAVLVAGALLACVAGWSRTETNSFLEAPAPSYGVLLKQVKTNKVVMDRYMRHFSMTREEVVNYFTTLRLSTLPKEGVYAVYNVPDSGVLRARFFRLRKGTKVWVDLANTPILKESCGNPMSRGPRRQVDNDVTVYDMESAMRTTVEEGDEVFIAHKPLEPIVPALDPVEPVVVTEVPDVTTASRAPMTIDRKDRIPPFLVLLPPLLIHLIPPRRNSPPPVPEPGSLIALSVGVGGIIARRTRKRRPSALVRRKPAEFAKNDPFHQGDKQHQAPSKGVSVLPVQLGNESEVHAVDARDEAHRHENGRQGGHDLHDAIEIVADDRKLGVEDRGEDISVEVQVLSDPQSVVIDVLEIRPGLGRKQRSVASEKGIKNVSRIDHVSAHSQKPPLKSKGVGDRISMPFIDLLFHRVDGVFEVVRGREILVDDGVEYRVDQKRWIFPQSVWISDPPLKGGIDTGARLCRYRNHERRSDE